MRTPERPPLTCRSCGGRLVHVRLIDWYVHDDDRTYDRAACPSSTGDLDALRAANPGTTRLDLTYAPDHVLDAVRAATGRTDLLDDLIADHGIPEAYAWPTSARDAIAHALTNKES